MKYKIVSQNKTLVEKIRKNFNIISMKESKHIQDVDLWLVDVEQISEQAIQSYKNRQEYSSFLFIVYNEEQIKFCLENGFLPYIKRDFTQVELNSWAKYFYKKEKNIQIHFIPK